MARCSHRKPRVSRRALLALCASTCIGAMAAAVGCADDGSKEARTRAQPPPPLGGPDGVGGADNIEALFDVLLPAERDDAGVLISPGAREAGAGDVLSVGNFARLAIARGLLPPLPEAVVSGLEALDGVAWATLDAELDALASLERPLVPFRDLPRDLQERVVASAWDDDALRPALLVVRAACFTAYLGAVVSDVGLRAVGYPPFEDFAAGIAVSGYPRTTSGKLVDPSKDDLATLAAQGELDDYTYDLAPAATPGDNLSLWLDANGDLIG